jgi:hypothetical protein
MLINSGVEHEKSPGKGNECEHDILAIFEPRSSAAVEPMLISQRNVNSEEISSNVWLSELNTIFEGHRRLQ